MCTHIYIDTSRHGQLVGQLEGIRNPLSEAIRSILFLCGGGCIFELLCIILKASWLPIAKMHMSPWYSFGAHMLQLKLQSMLQAMLKLLIVGSLRVIVSPSVHV